VKNCAFTKQSPDIPRPCQIILYNTLPSRRDEPPHNACTSRYMAEPYQHIATLRPTVLHRDNALVCFTGAARCSTGPDLTKTVRHSALHGRDAGLHYVSMLCLLLLVEKFVGEPAEASGSELAHAFECAVLQPFIDCVHHVYRESTDLELAGCTCRQHLAPGD